MPTTKKEEFSWPHPIRDMYRRLAKLEASQKNLEKQMNAHVDDYKTLLDTMTKNDLLKRVEELEKSSTAK
jgi:hypothetical protein